MDAVDPDWEVMQQKTFTAWANNHLQKREMKIADLKTDLKGARLL